MGAELRPVPDDVKVKFYRELDNILNKTNQPVDAELDAERAQKRWSKDHKVHSLGRDDATENVIQAGQVIKIGDNNIVTLAFLIEPESVGRYQSIDAKIGLVQTHVEENNIKTVFTTKFVNSDRLFKKAEPGAALVILE